MEKPYILHMFTPEKNLSPFDVNMALDAGWTSVIPYLRVEPGEIQALVQDVIFSRSQGGLKRTGIFIGGRDTRMAVDMTRSAHKAMAPPFEVSVFADPSGAFTTAAAMVALVERQLDTHFHMDLQGKKVLALGGTGPVGQIAATLAAKAGAVVKIIGRQLEKAQAAATLCDTEFGDGLTQLEGAADANKAELIQDADIVFATAAAGIQVLSAELIAAAPVLKVAADVNAVPPSGIAGLDAQHRGEPLAASPSGAVGVGALAIGNVKYKTQNALLQRMRESGQPVYLSFDDAFEVAREFARKL
jgi:methylene-tetrahydromethanopterin dehydrogenase